MKITSLTKIIVILSAAFCLMPCNPMGQGAKRDSKFTLPPIGASEKQSRTDFALASQRQAWMRHPVLGDPSFDNFKRYDKNPVQRGNPPF
ncbi:MAG: hypothetical protein NTV01_12895, partial [Bacteroidia bacterium]|nr:hypothetical protein [Bacteroidia bacterium]